MEENREIILNESKRTISKLQLLSVFFGEEVIYRIYLRTQVIHKLFENTPELDINKLELFHLQYTVTVIDLLKKIKATNERNVTILLDEVQLNQELIDKLDAETFTENSFKLEQQRQALKINQTLRKLYQLLSEEKEESPFAVNINNFSARYAADFFFDIPYTLSEELTTYNPTEVYRNSYATIHRRLMGNLCKVDFRSEFFCGLVAGAIILEVYKISALDKYFLFMPSRNLFLFCELSKISNIDWSNNLSKKERIVKELKDKNDQLKSSATVVKTAIPGEIQKLIGEYHSKIDDVNFLQNLSDVDIQANILKAMLNTDSI